VIATCHYSYEYGEQCADPMYDAPEVTWTFNPISQVVANDLVSGKPLTASNGEVFVPGVEQDYYELVLNVTRSEDVGTPVRVYGTQYWTPTIAQPFVGAVNATAQTILGLSVPIRGGKCLDYSGTFGIRSGYPYWKVHYQLQFACAIVSNSYDRRVLDQGTFYCSSGVKTQFQDGGTLSEALGLLNGSGQPLVTNQTACPPTTPSAVFLTFRTFPTAEFANLNLNFPLWGAGALGY
jgi:hypothetical protein